MAVVIEIGGALATVDEYQWSSDDRTIERLLNRRRQEFGPSGSDPDPDRTLAFEAVRSLGAVIVRDDNKPVAKEGRVY